MREKSETGAWTVRPCGERDLDAMRDICIETSSLPLRDDRDRQFLLLLYCDPYVQYAAENCFVAVDAGDRPVGYILCAADTRAFFRIFRKRVLPQIRRLGARYAIQARGVCAQQRLCAVFAPAHLHIDLTASVRRKGVGTALMHTLKAHLASQGVARVELTCGSGNHAAIRFYQQNGFRILLKGFGACVMRAKTADDTTNLHP
ncbi:MAG: GNAT family N-acetyltransferase [Clostridia bacterium]|nr:GNAT family N-acetyltransferase [Clostridia bacterium]